MKFWISIFTLFVLCFSQAFAENNNLFTINNYTITEDGQKRIEELNQRAKALLESPVIAQDNEKFIKKSFVKDGYLWDLSILLSEYKINEMVSFSDDPSTGMPIFYPFSTLPYYMAYILLTARDQNGNYVEYYPFTACWPTKFVYEQVFTYNGDLDQYGTIPENVRDYTPVTFSELANNTTYTNKFQEVTYLNGVGGTPMSIENKFSFWTILENRTGNEPCMYEGSYDWVSYVDDSAEDDTRKIGSNFTFTKYEKENNFIKCPMRIYIANTSTGVSKNTVSWEYEGSGRVEGFEPTEVTLPSFGDLHLYNAGLGSSKLMGDANPFTEEWGPVTMFYCAIGGEKVIWTQATSGPFTPDAIKNGGIDTTDVQEIDENANAIWGYLYGDAKYANDITLCPGKASFDIILPTTEFDEILEEEYLKIGPKVNTFVPYGYVGTDGQILAWSKDYSIVPMCHNNTESLANGSRIAWGTPDGFLMQLQTAYKKTINVTSKGKIYYHYDPNDISRVIVMDMVDNSDLILHEPKISRNGNTISISSDNNYDNIFYELTIGSTTTQYKYESPFTIERNCIIKAWASKENYIDSDVTYYEISDLRVNNVNININVNEYNQYYITFKCPVEDAEFVYKIGEDDSYHRYDGNSKIIIKDNRPIIYYGRASNLLDSEIRRYYPDIFNCSPVSISYDGRYIKISSDNLDGCGVYYTLDGTEPDESSKKFDLNFSQPSISIDKVGTLVRVAAIKDFFNTAYSEFYVDYIYNGESAFTTSPNQLECAFEWCDNKNPESLIINGALGDADIKFVNSMSNLKNLILTNAKLENNVLEDDIFTGLNNLQTVKLPSNITGVGKRLFADSPELSIIHWDADIPMTSEMLDGLDNPNLTIFARLRGLVPSNVTNVVINGIAAGTIRLTPGYPFHCDEEFTAPKAEFIKDFTMTTGINECSGWETISLPFTAELFTHESVGELKPFAIANEQDIPFWLYSLSENGWVSASKIEEYHPYIISLPNNGNYYDKYNLSGKLKISAENATFGVHDVGVSHNGLRSFHTSMDRMPADSRYFVLNNDKYSGGYVPGSVFVPALRDVTPMEAYMVTSGNERKISIMDNVNGVDFLPMVIDNGLSIRKEGSSIIVSSMNDQELCIYDSTGRIIRKEILYNGDELRIDNLAHGVYIISGVKVIL